MNYVLTYNQDSAVKAGGGEYLTEGGAHIVTITSAKFVKAKTGSQGIEFSVVTKEGQKANYLNVHYAKAAPAQGQQGEPISGGQSLLNAMMGILKLPGMTAKQSGAEWFCDEFAGKTIGLFLQKKLTSKSDGSDSFGFEIVVPFNPVDSKTMREAIDLKPAQTIERIAKNYKDKDERKAVSAQSASSGGFGGYDESFANSSHSFG